MTVNFQTSAVILVCLVNLIFLALPQVLVLERAEGFLQFRSSVSPDEEEESQACGDKQISQAKCLLQWKPSYLSRTAVPVSLGMGRKSQAHGVKGVHRLSCLL